MLLFYFSSKNISLQTFLWRKTCRFWIPVEVFFGFWQKLFVKVVKTVFYVSRGTLFLKEFAQEKIRFFPSSDVHLFSLLLKAFFRQVLTISLLRVHENILSKNVILRNSFFSFSDLDRVIFEVSVKTSFVSLVKTAFKVSRGTLWSNWFLLRNFGMFHFFSALNEKSSDFLVKNSGTILRFALASPSYISRKAFLWN